MRHKYDVFISHKHTDAEGRLTEDAKVAEGLHDALTRCGLHVFLSHVSLAQTGASDYQQAIDSALDEASVLVAVTTKIGHLEAEWVRYEWSSFVKDTLSGFKLDCRVFVYSAGVRPVDLPRALRQFQVVLDGPSAADDLVRFVCGNPVVNDAPAVVNSDMLSSASSDGDCEIRIVLVDLRHRWWGAVKVAPPALIMLDGTVVPTGHVRNRMGCEHEVLCKIVPYGSHELYVAWRGVQPGDLLRKFTVDKATLVIEIMYLGAVTNLVTGKTGWQVTFK